MRFVSRRLPTADLFTHNIWKKILRLLAMAWFRNRIKAQACVWGRKLKTKQTRDRVWTENLKSIQIEPDTGLVIKKRWVRARPWPQLVDSRDRLVSGLVLVSLWFWTSIFYILHCFVIKGGNRYKFWEKNSWQIIKDVLGDLGKNSVTWLRNNGIGKNIGSF